MQSLILIVISPAMVKLKIEGIFGGFKWMKVDPEKRALTSHWKNRSTSKLNTIRKIW